MSVVVVGVSCESGPFFAGSPPHKVQTHQVRSLILIADGAARVLPARPEARAGGARGQRCSRGCRPAVVQEQCRPRPRSIQIRPN